MKELALLGMRALMGGTAVCLFAAAAEMLQPKKFAGIFAAAPSVALASLGITAASKGVGAVQLDGRGMIAGALGMIAYCVAAVFAIRRWRALRGSVVAMLAWAAAAAASFPVLAR